MLLGEAKKMTKYCKHGIPSYLKCMTVRCATVCGNICRPDCWSQMRVREVKGAQ
jgi:hypothetical protein